MIRQAPFIIRGEVQSATLFKVNRGRGYAPTIEIRLLPDRIYRGDQRPEFLLRYRQGPSHFPGHDCIDMRVGSNWLIFAKEQWNTKGKASYNNKKVSQ